MSSGTRVKKILLIILPNISTAGTIKRCGPGTYILVGSRETSLELEQTLLVLGEAVLELSSMATSG